MNGRAYTGMSMEMLLASFRNLSGASQSDRVDVERLVASGFLGRVMGAHKATHGRDPRASSRADVLEHGVQLRCIKSQKTSATKPASGFVVLLREQEKGRDKTMNRAAYEKWRAEQSDKLGKMPGPQDIYAQQARCEYWHRVNGNDSGHGLVERCSSRRLFLDSTASASQPFRSEVFSTYVRNFVGCIAADKDPGFTLYIRGVRQSHLTTIPARDQQAIPAPPSRSLC